MGNDFSRPPLSRPMRPGKVAATLTAEQRRTMKFVDASIPPQSPTRIPAPATKEHPQSPAEAKKLRGEICQEFIAKHGHAPDLEYVMSEVFRRLGIKLPRRAFK